MTGKKSTMWPGDEKVLEALAWADQSLPAWLNTVGPDYPRQCREKELRTALADALRAKQEELDRWKSHLDAMDKSMDAYLQDREKLVAAEKALAAKTEECKRLRETLEGIATGFGGAGGEDEGESWEETVDGMRKDAEAALAPRDEQTAGEGPGVVEVERIPPRKMDGRE